MKTAAVISIGNEVLAGDIIDTNSAYISKELAELGIPTVLHISVGDDHDMMLSAIRQASEYADFIFLTGGLGPTDDDITRHAIAEFLDCPLKTDPELIEELKAFFAKRSISMSEKNMIQAQIPEKARALPNVLGTAAGIACTKNSANLYAMPGVPSEMKKMFHDHVVPDITKDMQKQHIRRRKLRLFGTGESNIAAMLGDLMNRTRNPLINCTVSSSIITLHVIATGEDEKKLNELIEKDIQKLCNILGDYVFGYDDDTLASVVGDMLRVQKLTLATAESCTAGLISKLITDIPGSSSYFTHGWITYSNEAKISQLSVPTELIEKYGAVSSEVAQAMALNARKKADSDLAIAVTGIAGPQGGNEQKPVGLVYIAIADRANCEVNEFNFTRTREIIRHRTALTALNLLRQKLKIDK